MKYVVAVISFFLVALLLSALLNYRSEISTNSTNFETVSDELLVAFSQKGIELRSGKNQWLLLWTDVLTGYDVTHKNKALEYSL